MAGDQRDILEVLRFELYLLQQGSYRTDNTSGWTQLSYFRDSPTCLDFGEDTSRRRCDECLLGEFIPEHARNETTACSNIPLDEHGNTIASLNGGYNRVAVEQAVLGWLRDTVARLEHERPHVLAACL